jgi:hypothetical protein
MTNDRWNTRREMKLRRVSVRWRKKRRLLTSRSACTGKIRKWSFA